MNEPVASDSPADRPVTSPDPDQAWRVLLLVNDWVRHAETKLAATLGAVGISGGALFSLASDRDSASASFNIAGVICCAAIILAGISAMVGLIPTVTSRSSGADNPVFFDDIERNYHGNVRGYHDVLHSLTANHDELLGQLSRQVLAVSAIASRKFRWANVAIRLLLIDLLALGALTLIIALGL